MRRHRRNIGLGLGGLGLVGSGIAGLGLATASALAQGTPTTSTMIDAEVRRSLDGLGDSPIAAALKALGPDVQRYNDHIVTLANPFFEGRAPDTRGNRIAADYLEFYFKRFGLTPAFASTTTAADGTEVITSNDSFRQPFEAPGEKIALAGSSVTISHNGDAPRVLAAGTDYTVLGFSSGGTITAPLAFVGYSLADEEHGYATYADDADLSGKIALVLRFEPMDAGGRSRWADQGWSPRAALEGKLRAAARHNAAGIILVNPPGADDDRVHRLETLTSARGGSMGVPVVMMSIDEADRLVSQADVDGRSLESLRRLADDSGVVIDLPRARVTLDVSLTRTPNMTDNVGAVLAGRGDLADEFVIIGAHYDHVGYGYFGANPGDAGKIHPGADDNASGTSGMLLLAERLAEDYAALPADASARSILFLGFSAEESGLVGSRHFVNHPSISMSQARLMINLDMIGRVRQDREIELEGVMTAEGLKDWVQPLLDASGLKFALGRTVAPNSDHASFYRADIPILFFFTGTHPEYHRPGDVASLINQVGAVKIVNLVRAIAMGQATDPNPLKFTGPDPNEQQASPGPLAMKVRFGIAPGDYSGSKPGILVGGVSPGTSAAEAGLKENDLIIKWNGSAVAGVEEWMPMLSKHNPGDVVEIVYIRDGQEMTTKATLKARSSGG